MVFSKVIVSPIGFLRISCDNDAITAVDFLPSRPKRQIGGQDHPLLDKATTQLEEYFAGERKNFDLPIKLSGTEFQQQAWGVLKKIPFGKTISYGEQAKRVGDKKKARAVGMANGRNPVSIIVPCHRVIGSNGSLTGFGGGLKKKQWLLNHEKNF